MKRPNPWDELRAAQQQREEARKQRRSARKAATPPKDEKRGGNEALIVLAVAGCAWALAFAHGQQVNQQAIRIINAASSTRTASAPAFNVGPPDLHGYASGAGGPMIPAPTSAPVGGIGTAATATAATCKP